MLKNQFISFFLLMACDGSTNETKTTTSDTKNTDTNQTTTTDTNEIIETGTDTSEPVNDPYIEGRECPPDSLFTWENFGQAIMLNYCVGCHSENVPEGSRAGAPIGVDFNTHALTQQSLHLIYFYIIR